VAATASHRLSAVRAADLLVLHFDFYNLLPDAGKLRRDDPGAPAHVVLHFPFQHLLEEAFTEADFDDGGAPLWARLVQAGGETRALAAALGSAPSRVAFTVPDGVDKVPGSLEELLAFLATCHLNVVWTAEDPPPRPSSWVALLFSLLGLGGGKQSGRGRIEGERGRPRSGGLVEPEPDQTAIELPYRLILSPPSRAGFAHEPAPPGLSGLDRVELWHSRLGLAPGTEGTPRDHERRTARAVWVRTVPREPLWNPDDALDPPPKPPPPQGPFLASMSEFDRHAIAHLTSNRQVLDTAPLEVERLALSALGGWLDATGRWEEPPKALNLEEWTSRTALGRDHFVKLVLGGYLVPFRHRASLVQITERKWQEGVPGRPAALRQRLFVIVREPELPYGADLANAHERVMPLKRVRLLTLVTPVIDPPASKDLFRVTVLGQPFRFAIEGEDEHGNLTFFSMPLVFIAPGPASTQAGVNAATSVLAAGDAHRAELGGSPLALVREDPTEQGATTFPVARAAFGASYREASEPGFHPKLLDADVGLPAVQLATGQGATKRVEYDTAYRDHGFGGQNSGEVFARLLDPHQLDLGGSADRAGGLLSPSMAINGLSRAVGPLGGNDLAGFASGAFDPKKFFAGSFGAARLFGAFGLEEVLGAAQGSLDALGMAPKLVTKQLAGGTLAADWTFSPRLQDFPLNAPVFVPKDSAQLTLRAHIEAKATQVKADVDCTLENIELHLLPGFECIVVPIERIRFHAPSGAKPDIDVRLGQMRFVGPLSFVDTLREFIPLDGFSDPPALDVTPQGISSGFSIALPDIAVGMFALQHVSLGARLELPFIGPPLTVAFNFCTRNEPFLLTVSAFGGGGFFLVKADPRGMQRLEAAFEFGASVSMNFGVASGGVHVMAGVYFAYDSGKGAVLTGYFRVGGNVSVLGLVSVSIELYLSLTYESQSGKAVGRATLTVEIELFLFSASVEVACERKLAGSAGDPPFEKLLAPYADPDDPSRTIDPWATYCRAYA
jgi:hypothetical protein